MARNLRDAKLDTATARQKLSARGAPYFRLIEPGVFVGYRRIASRAGSWVVRKYVGGKKYAVNQIGTADDFSDANGASIFNFSQAQERARSYLHGAAGAGRYTVGKALDDYFQKLASEGRPTFEARRRIEAYVGPIAGIEVVKLDAPQLRTWLASVAAAPARLRSAAGKKQNHRAFNRNDVEAVRRRKSSANRTWAILRAALNFAYREGKVASPAAWERVEPFKGVDSARVRFLSHAEATRLINASAPDFRPLVETALATGCRYGELCRLAVEDFNADAGTVTVRLSKSGRSRHVVLAEAGVALFQRLTVSRPRGAKILVDRNGAGWTASRQARPMRDACKRANITPAISLHALRHSWASLAIKAGLPLWIVARNLGHADTRMVERHYGHVEQSFVADEIRRGAPQFGGQPSNVIALK